MFSPLQALCHVSIQKLSHTYTYFQTRKTLKVINDFSINTVGAINVLFNGETLEMSEKKEKKQEGN